MTASAQTGTQTILLAPAADTSLYQEDGALSNGLGPTLFVGRTLDGLRRRALLRFDTSAIPAHAVIESATLFLSVDRTIAEVVPIDVFRVTAAWGEGASDAGFPGGIGAPAELGDATWTFRVFPDQPWDNAGGDTAASASARFELAGEGSYAIEASADMIADLQAWLDQPASNFGWQFRADESQPSPSAKRLASREYPDAALQPRLEVFFRGGAVLPDTRSIPAVGWLGLVLLVAALALAGITHNRPR
ncbi:MAG TPA: DNRLRE domain-containing protein [Xanthomonadaceae bacterium]|nr:DNRLRE domain-containing protein [Xanthomonadaceae bacterium]